MKNQGKIVGLITVALIFLFCTDLLAVPGSMNFQGRLVDKNTGQPITDLAGISMTFVIYDQETDGNRLFEENQTVVVENGIYDVQLGKCMADSSCIFGDLPAAVDNGTDLWLEVWIDLDRLVPRQRITSTAFAIRAGTADNAVTLNGADSATYVKKEELLEGGAGTPVDWSNLTNIPNGLDDGDDDTHGTDMWIDGAGQVTTNGNVGIGNPAPVYPLDIQSSATNQFMAQFKYTGTYGNGYGVLIDSGGTGIRPALRVNTGSGTVLNVRGDGNIGIGTIDPATTLDVNGVVTATSFVGDGSDLTGINGSSPWTEDVTSIYYENGRVGIGTPSPNADLHVDGIDGFLSTGTLNSGTIPATGPGTRLMWYPKKAAFRAGGVANDEWDDPLVGMYSSAMGLNTEASGWYSTARGNSTTASGDTSTAFGSYTTASGMYSTAFGSYTTASGLFSTAFGNNSTASGIYSMAIGNSAEATGDYSTAFGMFTNAESGDEFVLGRYDSDYTPVSPSGWNSSDRLFVIGNGSSDNQRSDAMVMLKNGDTTINGNLIATSFSGDGSGLSNVTAATAAEVDWGNLTNVPNGLDDGDDVGIVTEEDPQVADNIIPFYVPKWSGTALVGGSIYDDNGKIGIGTDWPLANLVIHAADPTMLIEADGDGEEARLNLRNNIGNYGGFLSNNDTSWFQIGYRSNGADRGGITIPTSGPNTGNVGIGTINPAAKLDVVGDIAVSGTVDGRDIAADGAVLDSLQSSGESGDTTNDSWTGLTDVSTTGNVGIGTSSPAAKLDVVGDIAVSGTVDGRDIAADGARLDALEEGSGGDTTNDSWTGTADVYTTSGNVSIGTSTASGHKLNVMANSAGNAAVRGVDYDLLFTSRVTNSEGQLGVESPTGLPGDPTSVGVLGRKLSQGGEGVGVYGLNSDEESSNIAMYAVANGSATVGSNYGLFALAEGSHVLGGTNYGVYAQALDASDWAGYFEGNLKTTGRFEATGDVTVAGNVEAGGELQVNGVGSTHGLVFGSSQAKLYSTSNGLHMEAPNSRFYLGTESEYVADCGSYCLELSSGSPSSGVVNLLGDVSVLGDTSITGNVTIKSVADGSIIMELGEGLDYAEGFDVSEQDPINAGTVVVIDPDSPGKLKKSDEAYDTRVAGIIAGANSLGSGVRLGVGQFDHDVALAGRVFCNVEATETAIEPGDLLTTSSMSGYAMKAVDSAHAQGAILGKAMERLAKGETGQILVLVTLQ